MTTDKTVESTLQDDLRAAMSESQPAQEAAIEQTAEETSSAREELIRSGVIKPASDRDEHGRFKGRESSTEKTVAVEGEIDPEKVLEQGAATAGKWTPERAPTTWGPKAREQWASLPLDIRQEIIRREEAAVNGVRNLKEQYTPVNQFYKTLEPFVLEAKKGGAIPEQYIANVMNTERVLRTADVPTKFNALLQIADQYGIPLRDVINKSVGQEVLKTPQQPSAQLPPQVMQELQSLQQWRQHMEGMQVTQTMEQFAADPSHEFFEDVRQTMADLLEYGQASNLKDAYDKAVWMMPEVREVMVSRMQGKRVADGVAGRQLAAASASVRSPGKVTVDDEQDSDDIYSTVRASMKQLTTRRV